MCKPEEFRGGNLAFSRELHRVFACLLRCVNLIFHFL